jgi:hypothetical protein
MAQWDYTLKWGKQLHEAIEAEDEEMVAKCLIACYRELLNKLSDEDKDWKQFDIEEEIFCLENFDEDEDVNDYLEDFYDICDDVRAWIAI